MKLTLTTIFCFLIAFSFAQEENEAKAFFDNLSSHCGKAFEGKLGFPKEYEQFGGKKLVMHVRACTENRIKIPFFVGENKSRTWIITLNSNGIQLKHDHRHQDGTEDEVTMYGGTSTNHGQENLQTFPADQETKEMIPAASSNVWWIEINNKQFTYNLRRLGTERVFRVVFDLTKQIEIPETPWGWKD